MADSNVVVRPAATSWGSVLGGWVATIGASVIFAPLVAALLAGIGGQQGDLAMAVPVVIGILLSYVAGGYIAGRMADYRTSWHGMMTAFFSLFILLLVLLVGGLADRGVFAGSGIRSLGDLIPGVKDLNVDTIGNALSFGAILGFLAAIFGGWLGGLLAPSHDVVRTRPVVGPAVIRGPLRPDPLRAERKREVVRETRVVPSFGRKGGERVEDIEKVDKVDKDDGLDEVHSTHVDRS